MNRYAPAHRGAPLGVPRPVAAPSRMAGPVLGDPLPPPGPDPIFTQYDGALGYIETFAVLAITGSAAWVGIRSALTSRQNPYVQAASWVGGVGSALFGLFYLGAKSGLGNMVGLPAVRVSPV